MMTKLQTSGYSLIELLVVLAIFSILMVVATQSLILTLSSSTKSESIGRVRENLQYSVAIIERQLHNAKGIIPCPNVNPLRLDYLDGEGNSAYFECKDIGLGGYVASTSASVAAASDRITTSDISITDCSITVEQLTCPPNATVPAVVTVSLTAEDAAATIGSQKSRATSKNTIQLRQY